MPLYYYEIIFFLGYSQPRKSVSGHELPEVRKIRKTIFKDIDKTSPKYNLFVMQYAQIINHDTASTLIKEKGDPF